MQAEMWDWELDVRIGVHRGPGGNRQCIDAFKPTRLHKTTKRMNGKMFRDGALGPPVLDRQGQEKEPAKETEEQLVKQEEDQSVWKPVEKSGPRRRA